MIFGLEIALLIMGIVALCTGKLTLSGKSAVHGLPARLIGLIGLVPLPLSLVIGFAVGFYYGMRGWDFTTETVRWTLAGIEAMIALVCFAVMMSLGYSMATPTPLSSEADERPAKRRPRYDDEDEEDKEPAVATPWPRRRPHDDENAVSTKPLPAKPEIEETGVTTEPAMPAKSPGKTAPADLARSSRDDRDRDSSNDEEAEDLPDVQRRNVPDRSTQVLIGVGVWALTILCSVGGVGTIVAFTLLMLR